MLVDKLVFPWMVRCLLPFVRGTPPFPLISYSLPAKRIPVHGGVTSLHASPMLFLSRFDSIRAISYSALSSVADLVRTRQSPP